MMWHWERIKERRCPHPMHSNATCTGEYSRAGTAEHPCRGPEARGGVSWREWWQQGKHEKQRQKTTRKEKDKRKKESKRKDSKILTSCLDFSNSFKTKFQLYLDQLSLTLQMDLIKMRLDNEFLDSLREHSLNIMKNVVEKDCNLKLEIENEI